MFLHINVRTICVKLNNMHIGSDDVSIYSYNDVNLFKGGINEWYNMARFT